MHVLQVFHQYLSQTMNWAPRLLAHVPTRMSVAAPCMTRTTHRPHEWTFVMPWYQKKPYPTDFPLPISLRLTLQFDRIVLGKYARQLKNYSNEQQVDIWHCHFADVGCRWLDPEQRAHKPLVVSFYGVDYHKLPKANAKLRNLYPKLFQESAAIITEGPYGAQVLQKMGCPAHKIYIVPFGIAPLSPQQQKPRLKKPGMLRLLQAATITEKKGHLQTLAAFQMALAHCPNMHLTLVGEVLDRGLYQKIKQFIQQQQLESKVTILDFVANEQFTEFMQQFDVFIQPSCHASDGDCEGGAPVALLDAQRAGLPVIATFHCDIPFITRPEHSALLSEEGDTNALRRHIEQMYHMGEPAYRQMSEAAIRHVHLDFNISSCGQKLFRVYEQVLTKQ